MHNRKIKRTPIGQTEKIAKRKDKGEKGQFKDRKKKSPRTAEDRSK